MDEHVKFNFALVHFEGQAEYWFQTYIKGKGRVLWQEFTKDLSARFAKLSKESMVGEFHKLRQRDSTENCYKDFEALRSIVANEGASSESNQKPILPKRPPPQEAKYKSRKDAQMIPPEL
ncbi:hypothetical protein RJ639_012663 [Escallonia herrerae]|uniref:Retrotransposon gag domain-containing protein n=1 Tax=Escallonia herrerae TaxID=1293975 RepID=A0AA89AQ79_9ASTE|nr:hypothetical protein RJ639_012663 [Escallonia herrerae]